MDLVFYNVNECGDIYDCHSTFEGAQRMLAKFPNDNIVVVTRGSSIDRKMILDWFVNG